MKRLFLLLTTVLLLLSLTACDVSYSKTMPISEDFDEAYFHIQGSHLRVVVEAVDDKQVGYEFKGHKEHFRLLHVEVDDGALRVSLPAEGAIAGETSEFSTLYLNLPQAVLEHLDVEVEGEFDFICAVNAKNAIVTVERAACQMNQVLDISYEISDGASVAIKEAETVDVAITGQSKLTVDRLYGGAFVADVSDSSEILANGQAMQIDLTVAGAGSINAADLEFQDGNAVLRDNARVVLGKLYGDLAYDVDESSSLNVLEIAD